MSSVKRGRTPRSALEMIACFSPSIPARRGQATRKTNHVAARDLTMILSGAAVGFSPFLFARRAELRGWIAAASSSHLCEFLAFGLRLFENIACAIRDACTADQ